MKKYLFLIMIPALLLVSCTTYKNTPSENFKKNEFALQIQCEDVINSEVGYTNGVYSDFKRIYGETNQEVLITGKLNTLDFWCKFTWNGENFQISDKYTTK